MDEVEKVLGGVASSGHVDGGTTSTMFGFILTWMQESVEPHYVVATCNDIDELLAISQGAFLRRFDDIFFVDLPSENERVEILRIMNRRYKQNIDLSLTANMEGWTGAEIEKFTKASVYDGVDIALREIKPIFHQNRTMIEKAREWAKLNARKANGDIEEATIEGRRLTV